MTYLLDSNVFIEAKNRYYGLDFVPGFWDWLVRGRNTGLVKSIKTVLNAELVPRGDEVSRWAQANKQMFYPMDSPALASMRLVAAWANDPTHSYRQSAVADFLGMH